MEYCCWWFKCLWCLTENLKCVCRVIIVGILICGLPSFKEGFEYQMWEVNCK